MNRTSCRPDVELSASTLRRAYMLGPDTDVINGQMVATRQRQAYNPAAYGPALSAGPAAVSSVPPSYGAATAPLPLPQAAGAAGVSHASALAIGNPFSWRLSPLPWALLFLGVGLLGLRYIHWRA